MQGRKLKRKLKQETHPKFCLLVFSRVFVNNSNLRRSFSNRFSRHSVHRLFLRIFTNFSSVFHCNFSVFSSVSSHYKCFIKMNRREETPPFCRHSFNSIFQQFTMHSNYFKYCIPNVKFLWNFYNFFHYNLRYLQFFFQISQNFQFLQSLVAKIRVPGANKYHPWQHKLFPLLAISYPGGKSFGV